MRRLIISLVLLSSLSGFASAQNQTVTGLLSQGQVSVGDTVNLTVNYAATDDALTTGLGLRVHFDSSQVAIGDFADELSVGRIAVVVQADTNDYDGDIETDKFINAIWSDPFGGAWPSGVAQPATLFSAPFTAQSGFVGTQFNFTKSSNAAGYTFVADAVSLDRAPGSNSSLASLTLSSDLLQDNLMPSFDADSNSYSESVDNALADIDLALSLTDALASSQVSLDGDPVDGNNLALDVGTNTFEITIVAENGVDSTSYDLVIEREEPLSLAITSAPLINIANNNDSYSVSGTCNRSGVAVAVVISSGDISDSAGTPTACVDGVWAQNSLNAGALPEGVVTVSAEGQSGLDQVTTQTTITKDITAPAIIAPASIEVAATDASGTLASVDAIAAYLNGASGLDNVDSSINISNNANSFFSPGVTTVTFSATDSSGNVGAASSEVTVSDQTAPVITAPGTLTVAAVDATGTAASDAAIAAWIGSAFAADNFDIAVSVGSNAPSQLPLGNTTVTFSATDAAGNPGTATAVVTVVDQTAPVVTAPADTTVAAIDADGTAASNNSVATVLAAASAVDNVSTFDTGLTLTNDAPDVFPLGATVVTFSATDAMGLSHTASTTVMVTDQAGPLLTAPAPITVAAVDDTGTPKANAAVAAFLAAASGTDNVDSSVTVTNNAATTLALGDNLITFSAVDAAGNNAETATSTLTVADQTAPVITVPATLSVLGTEAGVAASVDAIAGLIASASATDNVDGAVSGITNNAPANFPFGTSTLTFTVSDAAGNEATAETAVTVSLDVIAPELTVPGAISLTVAMPGDVVAADDDRLTAFFAALAASDNKDGDISGSITDNRPLEFPIGNTEVTFTVADSASNSTSKTAVVSVAVLDTDNDGMPDFYEDNTDGLDPNDPSDGDSDLDGDGVSNLDEYTAGTNPNADELAPALTIPDDIVVSATGLMTTVDFDADMQASAIDNKDGELTPTSTLQGPLASGDYINTWSVTDAAGNTESQDQSVKVLPLVNLTPSSVTTEGSQVEVSFVMSGNAPDYPVTIPFTVSGTASAPSDFTAIGASLEIAEGTSGSVMVEIAADSEAESPETIVITLGEPTNAARGSVAERTLNIVEENLAPQLTFAVTQNQQGGRTVAADSGLVTVTASYTDQNPGDSHTFEWDPSANDLAGVSITDKVLTFDPSAISGECPLVGATVTDDGAGLLAASKAVMLRVVASQPVLSATVDTDGDGIFDAAEGLGDSDADGIADYLDAIGQSNLASVDADSSRVMQAPVGTSIALGNAAFCSGASSVGIDEDQLVALSGVADADYDYLGGLIDFTLSGDLDGASYNLVLPLESAIPANAEYRKFIDEVIGWQEFVVDATNAIASAAASDGACPAPGSELYVDGLTAGDNCIQLQIEDGGPNDADGTADGTLTDPSGLATLYFGPPSSDSSIELSAIELDAGSSTTATVTVTAVDSDGRSLLGMNVTATSTISDAVVSSFTEQGEGVYTATLTPGKTGGSLTVTATISDGVDSTTKTSGSLTINKSSGGGGCTVAVNQSPDISLLLLMMIGLGLILRRRVLKL
jgi:hypothetical protein